MGTLYNHVRKEKTLYQAWKVVRQSALNSGAGAIQEEARDFESATPSHIRSLAGQLASGSFQFKPQKGILQPRGKGKDPRPIVLAPLYNRIVQRAILDVLTDKTHCPSVAQALQSPYCIGGVRGVDSAIALIKKCLTEGLWYIRSDIPDFFTKIPRHKVEEFIYDSTKDTEFASLFEKALTTELENPAEIQNYLQLFPGEHLGVPQGCALSTLAGNLALQQFDRMMNNRNILCVRYIDGTPVQA